MRLNGHAQLVDPLHYEGVLNLILENDRDVPARTCSFVALGAFGAMVVFNLRYSAVEIDPLFDRVFATPH